ncbi:MAG: hypothetical protein KGJ78_02175 [Alphaproteobacteria bacterium]|nr:hypothetical protein [Alphaproteobacteria bacterium]
MRAFVAALAVGACAMAAAAQQTTILGKGMSNPNAPISYSADHFAADANSKTGVFYGNVIIRQGDVSMHADAVRFHVVDNKPDKIFAQGGVVVTSPSGVATGDNGVYDVNPRVVTLNGHVVLVNNPSSSGSSGNSGVMRGQALTVNLLTGKATLNGGEGTKGRIQGLFSTTNQNQNP